MKRIGMVMVAACLATVLFAQEYKGVSVLFPDAKPQGKEYKPQLAVAQTNVGTEAKSYVVLRLTGSTDYTVYDETTRLLIRFADSTKAVLPQVAGDKIRKEHNNNVVNGATLSFYRTFTSYQLTPEIAEKIQSGVGILKIRVVIAKGNAKDYDIAPAYQAKFAELLQKSYAEAAAAAKKAQTQLSDDDF